MSALFRCSRRWLVPIVALPVPLLLVTLGFASASPASASQASVLRVGVPVDVVDWDPQTSTTLGDQQILENVYRGLTVLSPTTKQPVGELASSWTTSKNGLTWTFKLRPTAKFSDGKPVRAADVVYSMDRILKPATHATSAGDLTPVKSVTAAGTEKVVFHLTQPYSLLPTVLQYPAWSAIIPAGSGKTIATHPDGAGPFEVASHTAQTNIILKKNPYYWGAARVHLSEVKFVIIPDANARQAALASGQINLDPSIALSSVKSLKSNSKLKVDVFPSSEVDELGFNAKTGPFANLKVRQAITYAINRPALAKIATLGFGKTAASMVSPVAPIPVHPSGSIPYNPTKAKQLLAAAGVSTGLSLTFSACGGTSFPAMLAAGQVIQNDLAAVGVTAHFVNQESSVWANQVITQGNYTMFVCGLISGNDPDQHLFKYFTTSGQYNFSHYTAPAKLNHLLSLGREVTATARRSSIYSQATTILNQQVPWLPLYSLPSAVAYTKNVHGFVPFPELNLRLELVRVS